MGSQIKQKLVALGLSSAIVLGGAYLVAPFEGKVNRTYLDPVDILTSCYGHTGPELQKGQVFTDEQCLSQLAEDLVRHDRQMMRFVRVPLTDEQHAAFLSFTYNVGVNSFKNSTLLRKLNQYDYEGACNELKRWNKANGRVLNGLTKRREAERDMCLGEFNEKDVQ